MRVPLSYRAGAWHGKFPWGQRKLYALVAGDESAPDPSLEPTLWRVVERWDESARAIEAFAASLLPDGRVRLDRREGEWFAARNCGFEGGRIYFDGVSVVSRERPSQAVVGFVTGEPDGYVSYVAILDGDQPIEIVAEV